MRLDIGFGVGEFLGVSVTVTTGVGVTEVEGVGVIIGVGVKVDIGVAVVTGVGVNVGVAVVGVGVGVEVTDISLIKQTFTTLGAGSENKLFTQEVPSTNVRYLNMLFNPYATLLVPENEQILFSYAQNV